MTNINLFLMLRNLKKLRQYAILNIIGFSLSLSLTLFAVFCILNETRYDRFHDDHERIYRLTTKLIYKKGDPSEFARVMPWVGPYLGSEFLEVASVARFMAPQDMVMTLDENEFKQEKVIQADSSFFDVFGFRIVAGDKINPLGRPTSAVLTRETAIKYYGTAEAVGNTFKIGEDLYTVTAIVESGKMNAHFSFNVLLSSYFLNRGWIDTESLTHRLMVVYTYVKFIEGFDRTRFSKSWNRSKTGT